jgi:hypothetical protein
MTTIKFPSGQTGCELLTYMGADHIEEKSEVAQRLIRKCHIGKVCDLENDELRQLISEVDWALDIKQDHIGDGRWTALQQYNLKKYHSKLLSIYSTIKQTT